VTHGSLKAELLSDLQNINISLLETKFPFETRFERSENLYERLSAHGVGEGTNTRRAPLSVRDSVEVCLNLLPRLLKRWEYQHGIIDGRTEMKTNLKRPDPDDPLMWCMMIWSDK